MNSVIEIQDEDSVHVVSDDSKTEWEALFVPSASSHRDPNRAPTIVAPSTPVPHEDETPSIPATPQCDPEQADPSPIGHAIGEATKIEAKVTQTPPLLSRLFQGYLEHTGIEACPVHQMDHGVRDPECVNVAEYLLVCMWSLGHMRLGHMGLKVVRRLFCYLAYKRHLKIQEH